MIRTENRTNGYRMDLASEPVCSAARRSGVGLGEDGSTGPVVHRGFGPLDRPVAWFAAVLLAEAIVFYVHVRVHIAPYYPQTFDQLSYIGLAQDILRELKSDGIIALVRPFLSPAPTGITYPVQGAFAALLFGYSRASLLTINLAYFLAAQTAIFFTMMRSRPDAAAAWLAISVFVACDGIFRRAGGIADFRIDFAAMCLFGIWICLVLKADQFSSRAFSVFAGLAAAALILMRFITAAFVGPVMAVLFGWLVIRRGSVSDWRQRFANYVVSGAIIVVIVVPALAAALKPINDYYVGGHIKGDEPAIRAAELGIFGLQDHLKFYPQALANYQIGSVGIVLIVIALLAAATGFARRRENRPRAGFEIFVAAAATILPMVVLTLDVSKSPVVAGVAVIPCLLLVMFCWRSLVLPAFSKTAVQVAVGFYVLVGFSAFVAHAWSPSSELSAADLAEVERLNLAIVNRGGETSRLAFDRLTDYFNPATVRYYWRESRGGEARRAEPGYSATLGGIFSIEPAEAMRAVENSDIVVLSDEHFKRSQLPFDRSIVQCWQLIDGYARSRMELLATGKIDDITYRIFVRRPP